MPTTPPPSVKALPASDGQISASTAPQLSCSPQSSSPSPSPIVFRRRASKSFSQVTLHRPADPTFYPASREPTVIEEWQEPPKTPPYTTPSASAYTSPEHGSVYSVTSVESHQAQDSLESDCPTWHQEIERQRTISVASSGMVSGNNVRGSPSACLFVASLSASRTEEELARSVTEHFAKWGTLLNVKVLKDWMHRPYSFVQFENVEDATRAMVEAHNTTIDGRHIRVEQARVNRTLFIAKSGVDFSDEKVRDLLAQFGHLESVRLVRGDPLGRNRISAFIKFSYRDDAVRAYTLLRRDSSYLVEWAQNLDKEASPFSAVPIDRYSIFVGQLNIDAVTREGLEHKFGRYGKIVEIHLVNKRTPTPQGLRPAFAFIRFEEEHAAIKAVSQENGSVYLDQTIRVQHREMHDQAGKMFQHYRYHSEGAIYMPPGIGRNSRSDGFAIPPHVFGPGAYGQYPCNPNPGAFPHPGKPMYANKLQTVLNEGNQDHPTIGKGAGINGMNFVYPPALGPSGQGMYFGPSAHSPMMMTPVDAEGNPVEFNHGATSSGMPYPMMIASTSHIPASMDHGAIPPPGMYPPRHAPILLQGPDGLVYPWYGPSAQMMISHANTASNDGMPLTHAAHIKGETSYQASPIPIPQGSGAAFTPPPGMIQQVLPGGGIAYHGGNASAVTTPVVTQAPSFKSESAAVAITAPSVDKAAVSTASNGSTAVAT